MNHRIIRDEDVLRHFVDWLPDLEDHECFYLCWQARKKYDSVLKSSDRTQLRRFTATKKNLIQKIKEIQVEVGTFTTKDGSHVIQDESAALYITPNPRDQRVAAVKLLGKMGHALHRQGETWINLESLVLTEIHKAKSRSSYVIFDFDSHRPHIRDGVESVFPDLQAVTFLRTKGGFHVLVDVVKAKALGTLHKDWFQRISLIADCDQKGDLMIPVPGSCQGGFVPWFPVGEFSKS